MIVVVVVVVVGIVHYLRGKITLEAAAKEYNPGMRPM